MAHHDHMGDFEDHRPGAAIAGFLMAAAILSLIGVAYLVLRAFCG
jgi:hypothetical protein